MILEKSEKYQLALDVLQDDAQGRQTRNKYFVKTTTSEYQLKVVEDDLARVKIFAVTFKF